MTLVARLRAIADALPDGASVSLPASELRAWLAAEPPAPIAAPLSAPEPATWRERLWTVPADTRLGVPELAEALDRSPDWCYRATNESHAAARGRDPLPCSRLDGQLVFTAGAVRRWLQASEQLVQPERITAARGHKRGQGGA
jgi:hypothetical protein